ncbi:MAG: single-stranded-DNA-specific exonuclease RecJ [Clostridiales bacterium]|jgi:single-stranded-DNA-specific exonuclease RecJ|nr:single-stranded-DNA-specific exonuclease RecJ [Clostridiales bacterium]
MNIELVKRNNSVDPQKTAAFAKENGLNPRLAELLFFRGIDTPELVKKFLNPDPADFYDPFLLKDMDAAVKRIEKAIENNEKVVVYGDYDADGICAAAIFSMYLSSRGLNLFTHIPNRDGDGYGVHIDTLEKIIENACPDLIITCDCGISAAKEVEYAQELGVDFIITDHHELSGTLPPCIVVNPKRPDCGYPIDHLCGAGVAFKVVHALGGITEAMRYIDLACVATIADLVLLTDENRLIVQLGLKAENLKNAGLAALLADQQLSGGCTAGDIAYKIAPRINAAGRMGDAFRAFELFTTADKKRTDELVAEFNDDNQRRKTRGDELYNEAVALIKKERLLDNRAVILTHPEWEKGITGILAARIAGDFRRPTFILVSSGDHYKGTSRGINGISIYDILCASSDLLREYGGHSQAAGFSIETENIEAFTKRVYEYLEPLPEQIFAPACEYDAELALEDFGAELAEDIEKMEPFGNGNRRPLFRVKVDGIQIAPQKGNPNHTNIVAKNGLLLMAFNFYSENQFLLGDDEKELIVEVHRNNYGGPYPKAIVKGVRPQKLYINDAVARANFLKYVAAKTDAPPVFTRYGRGELASLCKESLFSVLLIAGCRQTYDALPQKIKDAFVMHEFLYASTKNNYSRIIVSPSFDERLTLEAYDTVIFADTPVGENIISYINGRTTARVYVPAQNNEREFTAGLDMSRDTFGRYYKAVQDNLNIRAQDVFGFFKTLSSREPGLDLRQFMACFTVFCELGYFAPRRDTSDAFAVERKEPQRTELTASRIYNYLSARV